jgi:hypothetical protein
MEEIRENILDPEQPEVAKAQRNLSLLKVCEITKKHSQYIKESVKIPIYQDIELFYAHYFKVYSKTFNLQEQILS